MSTERTITVLVDGQPQVLPAGVHLAQLVESLGHHSKAVGTAVNGLFVSRDRRKTYVLQASDAVLLFQPIGGG